MLRKPAFWVIPAIVVGVVAFQSVRPTGGSAEHSAAARVQIRCLVGGPDPYWSLVIAGAEAGAEEFNGELDVVVPRTTSSAVDEQNAALVSVNYDRVDGLMLSPLSPREQTRLISQAAFSTPVVTFDNDAPEALTHYHVGADNRNGGRLLAELVRRALPEGGEVALFVGDNERETARVRRQVLINALAGKPLFEEVNGDLGAPLKAGDYSVVGTYLDKRDASKAEANAAAALAEHPGLKCMVGLYSKNGPACAAAAKKAGRSDDVTTIAFDQLRETLDGIRDGSIYATVAQDPRSYGYEAVRLLCQLHRRPQKGRSTRFSGRLTVTCQVVDANNLDEFEASQEELLSGDPEKVPEPKTNS